MAAEEKVVLTVSSADAGTRLDKYVVAQIENVTRSHVQKLIADGFICINGVPASSNHYVLRAGDVIEVALRPAEEVNITASDIPLDIVYEDSDVIIVNKPKGMVVHPAPGHTDDTMVNALMFHAGDNLSGINGELRPGIVHRIDRDTTGLLVVCKNDAAHNFLADQLSVHSINRIYYCLVFGRLKEKEGTVDAPIARHKTDRKKMAIDKSGRNAVTHYREIFEFSAGYSLVECKLETGRTHQIRVHMSSIGYPLVGDEVYGRHKQPYKTEGQMLHAAVLGFIHPTTREYIEFSSVLPEYFTGVLNKICSSAEEKDALHNVLKEFGLEV